MKTGLYNAFLINSKSCTCSWNGSDSELYMYTVLDPRFTLVCFISDQGSSWQKNNIIHLFIYLTNAESKYKR